VATQSGPSNCPTPSTIFREALSLEAVPQISGNGTYLFGERCNWRVLRPGPTRRGDLKEAATSKLVDSCLLGLQDSAKETSINSQIPSVAPRIGQLAESGLFGSRADFRSVYSRFRGEGRCSSRRFLATKSRWSTGVPVRPIRSTSTHNKYSAISSSLADFARSE
jgi:hypothetical protein